VRSSIAASARHATQFFDHKFGGFDRLMGTARSAKLMAVSAVTAALVVSMKAPLLSIAELAA
jgi:hypothetical protein